VWHGTADPTVNFSNAEHIVAQWRGVHPLPAQPTHTEASGKHGLQIWRDTKGRALIEVHSIAGMGHGTPIDARLVEGGSTIAPFMLDVGISSTLEIARFWGLAPVADAAGLKARPASRSETLFNAATTPKPTPQPVNPRSTGIGKVIEDALRAAGLMK
jgi:poly(3-hydroxybutyrate) depolymerase